MRLRHLSLAIFVSSPCITACTDTSPLPGASEPAATEETTATEAASEPRGARLMYERGSHGGGTSDYPLMDYHGGPVLHAIRTGAIFWGTSWLPTDAEISGMDTFYKGFDGSNYAATSDEYSDAAGAVTSTATYRGHKLDNSSVPGRTPRSVSAVLAEACAAYPDAADGDFYGVYTDLAPTGSFCAWHSYGTCPSGATIAVAFFFNLDTSAGCNPQSGLQSQGLAALANATAHEISEARTDPLISAWYDSQGQENGDKCAWAFGPGPVTLSDGSTWKLQGEWSNRAYANGTGFLNQAGQAGCIQ